MSSFRFIIIYTLCFCINKSVAQNDFMDYTTPREYTLAAITVDGVLHFDHDMIIQKSGLIRGGENYHSWGENSHSHRQAVGARNFQTC